MSNKNFFKGLVKSINDENMSIMEDGLGSSEFNGFIDTGSYIFNAAISGSLYGGMADNKVLTLAGEEAVGKTYFALSMMKTFLDENEDGGIDFADTEASTTKKMAEVRGLDTSRIILSEPTTIEDFRTKSLEILNRYEKYDPDTRPKMMKVLDSLGNLSTNKEIKDTSEGSDTKDMTRTQLIKGAFRVLRLKMAKLYVPMIVTNHVYDNIGGYGDPKRMSGGSGVKYLSDMIGFLSKAKLKESDEIVGNIITIKMVKARLSRENSVVKVKLSYDKGLDRYYGLVDLGLAYDIFGKAPKHIVMPDGSKHYEKAIYNNPEKFFTSDIMEKLEQAAQQEFTYGAKGKLNDPEDEKTKGKVITSEMFEDSEDESETNAD